MRRIALFSALLGASLCTPILASASTIRHDVADSNYTALAATFPSVGSILVSGSNFGSATIIGPNWILTAAHMGAPGSSGTLTIGGNNYSITTLLVHPNYDSTTLAFDFAVAQLTSTVSNVTPSAYYNGGGKLGRTGTSVGFGGFGTGLTGATQAGGTKRAFTNVIEMSDGTYLDCDFDNPAGTANMMNQFAPSSPTPTALEGNVAPGDSGGGLFMDFGFGQWLSGVTSYVWWDGGDSTFPDGAPYGRYGQGSGWADISLGAAWIQQTTGIAPVPEPASIAAVGLGVLALLRRRRTSK
jgi:hypothetical protein